MTTDELVPAPIDDFDLQRWIASLTDLPLVVQVGAPVLRRRAAEVTKELFGSRALEQLLAIMVEVMRRAPGVGLAAPQIGVPLRVFVAEDAPERLEQLPESFRAERERVGLPLLTWINPVLESASTETATFYEGCLSLRGFGALVTRARVVDVRGLDGTGRPISRTFSGWPARIMQHEADHLAGTLYIDRMISRSFAGDADLARLTSQPVGSVLREFGAVPGGLPGPG